MNLKKIIKFIEIVVLLLPGAVFSQFILPEDAYTTHRDRDVVRMDNENIEVKEIKSKKQEGRAGKVELSWIAVEKTMQLALLRSDQPISNLSAMQTAKVVTLLEPGTSSYIDTVLNPGEYYYAIVTYKNLTEQTAILKTNDNFTSVPVRFDSNDLLDNPQVVNQHVSQIKADIIDNKSVRIKWEYDYIPNVTLLIYRSPVPVTDETKLKSSLRLGSVPANKNYFDDEDGTSGEFYYAVMVQDPFGVEKMIFKEAQTYTIFPLKKPEILSMPIKSLNGFKYETDITLTWHDPQPQVTDQYIVYRSLQPIINESDIGNATIIERVQKNLFKYIDKGVPEGEFFYAVLTQNSQGTVQKTIIPGENSLTKPVKILETKRETKKEISEKKPTDIVPIPVERDDEISIPKDESLVYDVHAVAERSQVLISWKPDKKLFEKIAKESSFYHLFRFKTKPAHIGELSPDNYIAKIPIVNESYYDSPVDDGLYYYAVFVTTTKGLLPSELRSGDNLVGPVIFKKTIEQTAVKDEKSPKERRQTKDPQFRDQDFGYFDETSRLGLVKLNDILRRTYLQKKYREASAELEDYRRSSSGEVRAKANFYMALSNYYIGNFESAMNYILDSSVRMYYKDRADFWYKQILEKMTQ